jgi:hypothetical protein
MNVRCACIALGLATCCGTAFGQWDDFEGAADHRGPEIIEPGAESASCRASEASCCGPQAYCFYPGWFLGLGGSYNSVRVDQSFTGNGVTNVYEDSELVATGAAGGPAPPFHQTLSTFAPLAQVGFIRPMGECGWLWGTKFSYKYLGLTFTDQNVDAPQIGTYTPVDNPSNTTTFTGNATVLAAQTEVRHELALVPFLGFTVGRGQVYVGGGPVVFDTATRFYGLSSHADIDGERTNIGGLPLNLASDAWMWGGIWQAGLTYYVRPRCFIDFNYDFKVTGCYNQDYPVLAIGSSGDETFETDIVYANELRIWAQSFNVTLNVVF